MSDKKSSVSIWLIIGVIVLIVLLFAWLTIADLWGDTDVAAYIPTTNFIQNMQDLRIF